MCFVSGLAAAPDVKVVTETQVQTIKIPKLIVLRDDERVIERVEKPFPKECNEALEYLDIIRSHDKALDKATQSMPQLLSEGQRLLATGTAAQLVPVIEAMTAARQDASNASIARAEALIQYDEKINTCRPSLEGK